MSLITSLIFSLLFALSPVFSNEDFNDDLPTSKNIAGMNAIVIEVDKSLPYIVYLHGFGGIGMDVYEEIFLKLNDNQKKQFNWIFPDSQKSGSWFNIMTEDQRDWELGLEHSKKSLEKMIQKMKLDPSRVILAGFSQGAITATHMILKSKEPYMGLIVNSGSRYEGWSVLRKSKKSFQYILTHDPQDQMLPIEEVQKLHKQLQKLGHRGTLKIVDSDHAIPQDLFSVIEPVFSSKRVSCVDLF